MRFLIVFLTFSLITLNSTQAQISEQIQSRSKGAANALVLEIPNADAKLIGEVWKDYMKDFYKAKPKWDRKAKEWISDDADITAIGQGNTIDIYATTSNNVINVWFDLGGAYLSSREHPEQYTEAEKVLMRFALEVAQEKTRQELDGEMDEMKKLQREMGRLKSLNERYHKEIERAEAAIKKAQEDIVENQALQEGMLEQIAEQESVIEKVQKRLNDL